jgi:Subtilase family
MRRLMIAVACCALAAGCSTVPAQGPPDPAQSESRLHRQILLTVAQDNTAALSLLGDPSNRYVVRRGYRAAPSVDRTLDQIAKSYGIRRVKGWPIASLSVYCEVFEVEDQTEIEELLEKLARDPRVDLAQRMNVFETLSSRYDDPYVDLQASVDEMSTELAHEFATGRGITVAVIDSQVDASHPDLRGKVRLSRDLVPGRRIGGSGELHGTAVAGIIASAANNTEGIVGVAPDVSIAALRACWAVSAQAGGAQCSSFSLAQALEVALNIRPGVINLSLAGPEDPLLSLLIDRAIERGIVVVAARPESPGTELGFPSSHPRVLAAQSEYSDAQAATPFVLVAPGTEIITTTPDDGYAFLSGNSLAAAHVSGVVALMLERNPQIDVDLIARLLTQTTTVMHGRRSINACEALAALVHAPGCAPRTSASL